MVRQKICDEITESVLAIVPFFWLGAICAISFMEAWIKFRAEGMTLPLGLSVGALVFGALNKIEWGCCALLAVSILMRKRTSFQYVIFSLVLAVLLIQTFYLFPILFGRIASVLRGDPLPPSFSHVAYVSLEFVKAFGLFALGIYSFQHARTQKDRIECSRD